MPSVLSPIRQALLSALIALGPFAAKAQPLGVTLSPTNYNGYHISCFGEKDGAIVATVTGGSPPYTYEWSSGSNTDTAGELASGYYRLVVTDEEATVVEVDITLVEPLALRLASEPVVYPNGHNISCHDCFNGSIDLSVFSGVAPYAYEWSDGATTQDRSGLGPFTYLVTVTDANGCSVSSDWIGLTQPESSDWTMNGNAGTSPQVNYIGTSDNADLVLKSNGEERLRLTAEGDVKIFGPGQEPGPVYRMEDGSLRGGGLPDWPELEPPLCRGTLSYYYPYWETTGNTFAQLCPEMTPLLGTLGNRPLIMITNGEERMRINANGKVGIGTTPPGGAVDGYRLFVEDGIATRDVLVKLGSWPDYVFNDDYRLMPLPELRAFLKRNKHLPGIPSASELEALGGVALGDLQRRMLETIEEQALYILQLEERLVRMEQRMATLEASR